MADGFRKIEESAYRIIRERNIYETEKNTFHRYLRESTPLSELPPNTNNALTMKPQHIHFIGICGVAMSALALAFKREGWKVTGSDVGFYPPISTYLKDNNVDYYPGWHPEKMVADGKPDVVVVGNVAGTQNPEWLYVQKHKLNYKSYPEIIKEFFIKPHSIVCAGTYGKSTSTTLLTWILKETGYNPSYMFGGLSLNNMPSAAMSDPANFPRESGASWSVVEGDEYKASRWDNGPKFAYYSPSHLLLTSVVWDHADVYPTEADYFEVFTKLYKSISTSGVRVISEQADHIINKDTGLASAFKKMLRPDVKSNTVIYGKTDVATYRYTNIAQTKDGLQFDIIHNDKKYTITSPCLGEYMADNITGCFAMADQIGIAPEKIIAAIKTFAGMKRRLEKRFDSNITIFDDIAHSPTKAKSVLKTLKTIYNCHPEQDDKRKIIAVFEPNTGNRRPQAESWYDNAFAAADEVVIPRLTKIKIDEIEEPPFEGEQLASIIGKTHPTVRFIDEDAQLIEYLSTKETGSIIIFLGSHGFRGMIEEVVKNVENKKAAKLLVPSQTL